MSTWSNLILSFPLLVLVRTHVFVVYTSEGRSSESENGELFITHC